jgi:hypothetical protein
MSKSPAFTSRRNWLAVAAGVAALCIAGPASAQIELKVGHVGAPGSLFQARQQPFIYRPAGIGEYGRQNERDYKGAQHQHGTDDQ